MPVISKRYSLKENPGALVRITSGLIMPIERKSAQAPKSPYDGDLIQAIAYGIPIEDQYGQPPLYAGYSMRIAGSTRPIRQSAKLEPWKYASISQKRDGQGPSIVLTVLRPNAATAHNGRIVGRRFDCVQSRKR